MNPKGAHSISFSDISNVQISSDARAGNDTPVSAKDSRPTMDFLLEAAAQIRRGGPPPGTIWKFYSGSGVFFGTQFESLGIRDAPSFHPAPRRRPERALQRSLDPFWVRRRRHAMSRPAIGEPLANPPLAPGIR